MKFQILKNYKGFTIVELIVSITIIGMLSGMFLVNYHGTNNNNELMVTARKLSSDIRIAQNYSLGLKEHAGSLPRGGWGLHFNKTTNNLYIIFAETDDDDLTGFSYDVAEKYQQLKLPNNIKISELNVGGSSVDYLDLVFEPPYPRVRINQAINNNSVITLSDGQKSIDISINHFGLVEIK